jgi:hypothetical protein
VRLCGGIFHFEWSAQRITVGHGKTRPRIKSILVRSERAFACSHNEKGRLRGGLQRSDSATTDQAAVFASATWSRPRLRWSITPRPSAKLPSIIVQDAIGLRFILPAALVHRLSKARRKRIESGSSSTCRVFRCLVHVLPKTYWLHTLKRDTTVTALG